MEEDTAVNLNILHYFNLFQSCPAVANFVLLKEKLFLLIRY